MFTRPSNIARINFRAPILAGKNRTIRNNDAGSTKENGVLLAVAAGPQAGLVDLVTGERGTVVGTQTPAVKPGIGWAIGGSGGANQHIEFSYGVRHPGPREITLLTILTTPASGSSHFFATAPVNEGWRFLCGAGAAVQVVKSNQIGLSTSFTLLGDTPYAIGISSQAGGNALVVAKNLLTGQFNYQTITNSNNLTNGTTNNVWLVGGGLTSDFAGKIAALMLLGNNTGINGLVQWTNNPWAIFAPWTEYSDAEIIQGGGTIIPGDISLAINPGIIIAESLDAISAATLAVQKAVSTSAQGTLVGSITLPIQDAIAAVGLMGMGEVITIGAVTPTIISSGAISKEEAISLAVRKAVSFTTSLDAVGDASFALIKSMLSGGTMTMGAAAPLQVDPGISGFGGFIFDNPISFTVNPAVASDNVWDMGGAITLGLIHAISAASKLDATGLVALSVIPATSLLSTAVMGDAISLALRKAAAMMGGGNVEADISLNTVTASGAASAVLLNPTISIQVAPTVEGASNVDFAAAISFEIIPVEQPASDAWERVTISAQFSMQATGTVVQPDALYIKETSSYANMKPTIVKLQGIKVTTTKDFEK